MFLYFLKDNFERKSEYNNQRCELIRKGELFG